MTDSTPPETIELPEAFDLYHLAEHNFVTGVQSGHIDEADKNYRQFRRAVTDLYHGNHDREKIHTALIVAHDELTILIEDEKCSCAVTLRFAEQALQLLNRFLARLTATPEFKEVASLEEEETPQQSETAKTEPVRTFKWTGAFTEFVEWLDGTMNVSRIDFASKKAFIGFMLDSFGVGKSVDDFHRALKKLEQKAPAEGQGRCILLKEMLKATEETWEWCYMDKEKTVAHYEATVKIDVRDVEPTKRKTAPVMAETRRSSRK